MKRLRILLADDQAQILTMLQALLEPEHQVVGTAADGRTAIEAARVLHPDIMLTDVDMPVMNGIEAAREIHKDLPGCRVIFYSSHGEPETMAAAFAAGASGYLIKGSAHSLLASIRSVVRHVWSHDEDVVMG